MYQIPELKDNQDIFHAFSVVADGNMSFLWGEKEEVLENRKKFFNNLGIQLDACVSMKVLDEDNITIVDGSYKRKGMSEIDDAVKTDGLITQEKGLYLFLLIADCLPVIVFDPVKKVLGLLHCSWKSTEAKLASKIIDRIINEFHCDPANIVVGIGPSVKQESFCFVDPIQKKLDGWQDFLKDIPDGQTCIDLMGYNQYQLEKQGVLRKNIHISPINTATDQEFFSHYRDSRGGDIKEGRFACLVSLKL